MEKYLPHAVVGSNTTLFRQNKHSAPSTFISRDHCTPTEPTVPSLRDEGRAPHDCSSCCAKGYL